MVYVLTVIYTCQLRALGDTRPRSGRDGVEVSRGK